MPREMEKLNYVPIKYLLSNDKNAIKSGPFGSQLAGSDFSNEITNYWVYNQRSVLDKNGEYGVAFISKEKFDSMKSFQVKANDILITTRGTIGKIYKISEKFNPGIIHPCLIKFCIDESKMLYDFLELVFNNSGVIEEQIYLKSNSTTIEVIYSETLKNLCIPCPSIKKQKEICKYLTTKCSEIDQLHSDIEKQIEILEEYKKSVITEAVTKGLDPDVEMKDSGIEWIGEIPKNWDIKKGKYIFVQKSDRGNSESLVLLSPTQNYGVIPQELYEQLSGFNTVKLNEKTNMNLLKTVHKGAFVISLRSFQGGFEYSYYEGVVSPAYQVFYAYIPISDIYYKYLFKADSFINKMNSYTMSLRDGKNIAFTDFGQTYLPMPPLTEQQKIANFLDTKCSEIDETIATKKQQLSILEEYKKSLIYEYVTGKKEVSDNV